MFVNNHRQLFAPFAAQAGADYQLQLRSRPGYAECDAWALGLLTLQPHLVLPLFLARIPAPAGFEVVHVPIPNHPALLGLDFDVQAILFGARHRPHRTGMLHARIL